MKPVDKEEQDDGLEDAVFHLGGAFDSLIGVQGGRQLSHLLGLVEYFHIIIEVHGHMT